MTADRSAPHPVAASRRLQDWQSRLGALVNSRLAAPFAWGTHDCCLWAADAVLATTGRDLAGDLRGTYRTAGQAAEVLHRHGGVVGLAVARLGPVVPAALAQPGDVGLITVDHRHTLAVCGGAHFLAAGSAGLVSIPAAQVIRAWRCTREVPRG